MVQSNSIAETMNTAFGIPTWVMGLIVVILAGPIMATTPCSCGSFTSASA